MTACCRPQHPVVHMCRVSDGSNNMALNRLSGQQSADIKLVAHKGHCMASSTLRSASDHLHCPDASGAHRQRLRGLDALVPGRALLARRSQRRRHAGQPGRAGGDPQPGRQRRSAATCAQRQLRRHRGPRGAAVLLRPDAGCGISAAPSIMLAQGLLPAALWLSDTILIGPADETLPIGPAEVPCNWSQLLPCSVLELLPGAGQPVIVWHARQGSVPAGPRNPSLLSTICSAAISPAGRRQAKPFSLVSCTIAGRGRTGKYARSASMEDFRPARVEVVDDPAQRIPPPAEASRDMQVPAAAALMRTESCPITVALVSVP